MDLFPVHLQQRDNRKFDQLPDGFPDFPSLFKRDGIVVVVVAKHRHRVRLNPILTTPTKRYFPDATDQNTRKDPAREKHSFYVVLFLLDDFMNP